MPFIFVSPSTEPFYNLAIENCLFNQAPAAKNLPGLYLWRNADVVVIGRFQNPWKECALERMEKDGVRLMRRDTGGGAVFQDIHNVCFSFIGPVSPDYRVKNTELVCRALARLGFNASASGRNDITINGMKISGAAYREKNGMYLHHGTLLVGTDLTRLANYLNPDKKKLESKGVKSVRARVTNLQALEPQITAEKVVEALRTEFCAAYGECAADEKPVMPALESERTRLAGWDWRFGRSPEFTHKLEERFDWGGIEILLTVKNAVIADVAVFTDALDTLAADELSSLLRGARYDTAALGVSLEQRVYGLENTYPAAAQILRDVRRLLQNV